MADKQFINLALHYVTADIELIYHTHISYDQSLRIFLYTYTHTGPDQSVLVCAVLTKSNLHVYICRAPCRTRTREDPSTVPPSILTSALLGLRTRRYALTVLPSKQVSSLDQKPIMIYESCTCVNNTYSIYSSLV
jgi:hypothetical protein